MATLSNSKASSLVRKVAPANVRIETRTIDFSLAANTMAQNDIMEIINVPANCYVPLVWWEVTVVEGAARNFAIGDGADDDGYEATTSANALATGVSGPVVLTEGAPNTVTAYSAGKYYSTADTIDVKAVTAGGLTTATLVVSALIWDFNT